LDKHVNDFLNVTVTPVSSYFFTKFAEYDMAMYCYQSHLNKHCHIYR